jgi:archaellum component FlaD/FlaE
MIRRLLPRFECDRWGGPAVGLQDVVDVRGFYFAIGWLGFHVELCLAREVRRP